MAGRPNRRIPLVPRPSVRDVLAAHTAAVPSRFCPQFFRPGVPALVGRGSGGTLQVTVLRWWRSRFHGSNLLTVVRMRSPVVS